MPRLNSNVRRTYPGQDSDWGRKAPCSSFASPTTPTGQRPGPVRSARRKIQAVDFEWDPEKDARNQAKHGVDFAEARTIFGDPFELATPDPDHSVGEYRFLSTGLSESNHLLVVSYTEREERIRIISARYASPREREVYESRRYR